MYTISHGTFFRAFNVVPLVVGFLLLANYSLHLHVNPYKDEAHAALFKDLVRTAQ
jgi:hypothetical protein